MEANTVPSRLGDKRGSVGNECFNALIFEAKIAYTARTESDFLHHRDPSPTGSSPNPAGWDIRPVETAGTRSLLAHPGIPASTPESAEKITSKAGNAYEALTLKLKYLNYVCEAPEQGPGQAS